MKSNDWISIDDEMPKDGEFVMCYDAESAKQAEAEGLTQGEQNLSVAPAFYVKDTGFCMRDFENPENVCLFGGVSHWMRFPEPPQS